MEEKIFKAVIDKFEHDVVDELYVDYNIEEIIKNNNKISYYFEKNITLDDADETVKQQIEDKYWDNYEFNEFDDWWKFNGDDWAQEFKKNHGNEDDMMVIAFDEWMEKYGLDCWDGFDDFVNLKKYIELTIINDHEDKIEFICETYYEHDLENGELFKTVKSFFLYEVQFDRMCELINSKFNLDVHCKDTLMINYLPLHEAKIHNISKKLIF